MLNWLVRDSNRWSSSVYVVDRVDRCVSLRQKALSQLRCSDMPSRGISVDYPSHGHKPSKVIANCKRLPQGILILVASDESLNTLNSLPFIS